MISVYDRKLERMGIEVRPLILGMGGYGAILEE